MQRELLDRQIWVGMVDSERVVRYCDKLARKMRFRHNLLSAFLTITACGSIAPLMANVSEYIVAVILVFVAFLSVWFLLADYSGKATASKIIAEQYRDLALEWRALWNREATQQDIIDLQHRFYQIDKGVDVGNDENLNKKAMDEAESVLWGQFGSATNGNAGT